MNSSGIKRGLAGSAVAALAVTGLPFLASTASAAAGDTLTVLSTGPALNGGNEGAVVVLRAKDGTVDVDNLALTSTSSSVVDSQNTADQNAEIVSAEISDDATAAYEDITVHIAVTTSTTGDAASFRIFDNDGTNPDALEASEARANVSVSTTGPVASIDVSPSSQSVAQGETSGDYTVTVKDSAGRTTQLQADDPETVGDESDSIDITVNPSDVTLSDANLSADDIATGSAKFSVDAVNGDANSGLGDHTITLTDATDETIKKTAKLTVTPAATVTAAETDIVTGADSWDGFGDGSFADGDDVTAVRVDQTSIRIDIKDSTPKGTVTLTVAGDGVTFGGKDETKVTTVLDADGNGSLTITPDAGTISDGDSIRVDGSGFGQTFEFERAAATNIDAEQTPYFGKRGGSVDVKVTVTDQFGNPVTTGFIGAKDVDGPNESDTLQAKPVDSTGSATFTFTDAKATDADSVDTIAFGYAKDQYVNPDDAFPQGGTQIKWTATGQGADFGTSLQGHDTESTTYKVTDANVDPLADAVADDVESNGADNETAEIEVDGTEPNQAVTVSVDNGALILPDDEESLAKGQSSVTDTADGTTFDGYRIVGTKSGVVNVTVTSANRTETAQMTVNADTNLANARNVTVSGPASVPNGTPQITYTAVVTDAFGNPIANFPRSVLGSDLLNVQVSGPGQYKDGDGATDANGQLKLNVAVASGAVGDVTIQVKGVPNVAVFGGPAAVDQFGAQADRLNAQSTEDDAKGLSVSSNIATATTTVEPAPVVQESINLTLSGKSKGKKDVVKANASDNAAGLTAVLYKNGKQVKSHELNGSGDWTFTVKDKNGNKKTKYQVKVAPTETTKAGKRSITIK